MAAVRNVIFDLGGVLLDWNPGRILERCYSDRADQDAMRDALFGHADWVAYDRGDISEPVLLARVQHRTGRALPELTRLLDVVRDSLIVKPDTLAVLRSLYHRHVPLYCLSNMPVALFTHVRSRYDFWDAFAGIVISGAVHMAKPELAVFEYLLRQYKLMPEETVFVDDHPPNLDGAKAARLRTILFRNAEECARELDACLNLPATDPGICAHPYRTDG
jgi:FMN phosphatase YigB (HAD superfamily)